MRFKYVPPGSSNSTAKTESGPSKREHENLEERFEKLKLVTIALWTYLKEQKGLKEEELMQRVKEIDMLDGSADGKLKLGVRKCGKCSRALNPKFEKCQYCGHLNPPGSIFETF